MDRGRLITVEGVEGAGKSTQARTAKARLDAAGIDCLLTREPGGTALAEKIRSLLLGVGEERPDALCELLLVFAARAQHLARLVGPALEAGKWVLCDRFADATYAYQGAGRGIEQETITGLETLVQGALRPDLTFILDVDPRTGLERTRRRGGAPDRFEQEEERFFADVRNGYLEIAAREPERCVLIDAGRDAERVGESLAAELDARIREWTA